MRDSRGSAVAAALGSLRVKEVSLDPVVIESDIPAGHPQKQAIEEAIVAALKAVPGPWKVKVICSHIDVWWVLALKGPGFDWALMLKDPKEQKPEFVFEALKNALRARPEGGGT